MLLVTRPTSRASDNTTLPATGTLAPDSFSPTSFGDARAAVQHANDHFLPDVAPFVGLIAQDSIPASSGSFLHPYRDGTGTPASMRMGSAIASSTGTAPWSEARSERRNGPRRSRARIRLPVSSREGQSHLPPNVRAFLLRELGMDPRAGAQSDIHDGRGGRPNDGDRSGSVVAELHVLGKMNDRASAPRPYVTSQLEQDHVTNFVIHRSGSCAPARWVCGAHPLP